MAGNLKQGFNDSSMSAFTNRSDEDIVKIIKDKDSKATKKNTKQAFDLLKEFYANVRKKRWIVVQQEWPNLSSLRCCKPFLPKYKVTRFFTYYSLFYDYTIDYLY